MPTQTIPLTGGLVTSKDPADLRPGELQQATGAWYKPGDPSRLHKISGRASFADTSSAAKIKGLALAQYDSGGIDRLLALSGTVLYSATPGITGTFSSLVTGLSSSATIMSAAHFSDRWYICNGYDYQRVISSSGSVRRMGIESPQTKPVATPNTTPGTYVGRPTAETNGSPGFTNPGSAYDSDPNADTYAHAALSAAGSATCTWHTITASSAAGRWLTVTWTLAGIAADDRITDRFGDGGTYTSGYEATVKIEKSENYLDVTPTWTTLLERTYTAATGKASLFSTVTANSNAVAVKATITYVSGTRTATLRIHDIKVSTAPTGSPSTSTTGLYYGCTFYNATEGIESAPGPSSTLTTLTAAYSVALTLPTPTDTQVTHVRVYRTVDGGAWPNEAWLIAEVPSTTVATETTYYDDLVNVPIASNGTQLLRMLAVTVDEGTDYYPRDSAPPTMKFLTAWRGSLVGISGERQMSYSEAGWPESWPEINVITSFPLPERDELIALAPCGDTLIVAAKGAMLRLTDLPRVTQGVFNAAEAEQLRGQPGCVGAYAICQYSIAGESRVAWVSPHGVHETNGQMSRRLSTSQTWASTVNVATLSSSVLYFDPSRMVLVFAYDSDGGGTNDRYMLLHVAPEHDGFNNEPKWTGPHYGSIACLVGGMVSSTYRLYSGHVSNGIVYLEEYGTTDASSSYSSTTVPFIVKTGRIYGDDRRGVAVVRANVRHGDWGTGLTATTAWNFYEDTYSATAAQTLAGSVTLDGQRGAEEFVGLAGECFDVTYTETTAPTGTGAHLLDVRLDVQIQSRRGTVV